jgi:hypothetical protein
MPGQSESQIGVPVSELVLSLDELVLPELVSSVVVETSCEDDELVDAMPESASSVVNDDDPSSGCGCAGPGPHASATDPNTTRNVAMRRRPSRIAQRRPLDQVALHVFEFNRIQAAPACGWRLVRHSSTSERTLVAVRSH